MEQRISIEEKHSETLYEKSSDLAKQSQHQESSFNEKKTDGLKENKTQTGADGDFFLQAFFLKSPEKYSCCQLLVS